MEISREAREFGEARGRDAAHHEVRGGGGGALLPGDPHLRGQGAGRPQGGRWRHLQGPLQGAAQLGPLVSNTFWMAL